MKRVEKQMFLCMKCEVGSEHERGSKQFCPRCGDKMEPLDPVNTVAELEAAIASSQAMVAQEN